MVRLALLTAIAGVSAASIAKRDGSAMAKQIGIIKQRLEILNGALDSYTGGTIQAVPIKTAGDNVEAAMRDAVAVIKTEPTPTADEELKLVVDAIRDVNPEVKKVMSGISSKASSFSFAKAIVVSDVTRMKGIEEDMAQNLQSRAGSDKAKADAKAEHDSLSAMFVGALKALG